MEIFLKEFVFTLFILITYGLIDGFSLLPFRNHIQYPMLAAPMAGMLLWPMGIFILYCFVGLSVGSSAAIIAIMGVSITIVTIFYCKPKLIWKDTLQIFSVVFILAMIITYLSNFTSITFGHVGFLYRDGSDHLGYATMADWLKNHLISELPVVKSSIPYQSFPVFSR